MWTEILKYTLPAVLVIVVTYLLLHKLFKNEGERRQYELKKINLSTITPVRLKAYERLMLLLERINPNRFLISKVEADMNSLELHGTLLREIRREYEHNLSQQIYVSSKAWSMIVAARQSMVKLVGSEAEEHNPKEPYLEFATDILEEFASGNDDPVTLAINFLQREAKEIL